MNRLMKVTIGYKGSYAERSVRRIFYRYRKRYNAHCFIDCIDYLNRFEARL